ncbi:hypothetical protein GFER_16015 [Geoalkalibacter ferrihydriticus DSM 17813]|uniref:Uncharacterized protein n=1 Tax=Geoalkalibacter ferrihydriticus DSM 17813 TaxID=1121915 RepID=A0A0C2HET1_9BACT|nr:hypothetical protein GFER_16015 [Geoalkalibacter ferrihydriticus DSM 17813]
MVSFLFISSVEKGIMHCFTIFKEDHPQILIDVLDFTPHSDAQIFRMNADIKTFKSSLPLRTLRALSKPA